MINHENTLKNHGNQPKTMKNHETTSKTHGNMPMIPIMPSAPPLRDPPPAYEDIATQHIRHHQNVFLLEQQESTSDPTYLVVCT